MEEVTVDMEIIENYQQIISDVKQIIINGRNMAYNAVNSALLLTYWNIGKRIVENEQKGKQRADYGRQLIKTLSRELTADFGKGFSERNLADFRKFYQLFPDEQILQTRLQNLTWSHFHINKYFIVSIQI